MMEVVAAIIYNNLGEVLIAKRKKGKSLGGFWEFPGGKIEEGETYEKALIRELSEEMNVKIDVEKYFGKNTHDYGGFKIELIAYTARIVKGDIELKAHNEVRWVAVGELKDFKIAPADIPFVEKLIKLELQK